jgi:DNA excision repair protein ERCC-2
MFSATLRRSDFAEPRKALKAADKNLYKLLGKLAAFLKQAAPEEPRLLPQGPPPEFVSFVEALKQRAETLLQGEFPQPARLTLLDAYFKGLDFLRVAEAWGDGYAAYLEPGADPALRLLCLDPSRLLAACHKKSRCSVFFSATLLPLPYFRDVLGGTGQDFALRLPSPFPPGNFRLMIENKLSTRYRDRDAGVARVARLIYETAAQKPGNYFAFFPAYTYMAQVYEAFCAAYPQVRALAQARAMSEEARAAFLSRFDRPAPETQVAFVVMGGIFAEGIDLAGDRLLGVCVVGVGLPLLSFERGLIAAHYSKAGLDGFDYAYTFPGMNKVMQAVGRVIRSETDRGLALLIDSRFTEPKYLSLFPPEWSHYLVLGDQGPGPAALGFWEASQSTTP